MKQYFCKMPKGLYYIGDLCYVIRDDELWHKMCEEHFSKGFNGKFEKANNLTVWNCSTYYGDGCYEDGDNYFYPVDSGSIGIVLIDDNYRAMFEIEEELGRLYSFEEEFEVYYDNGVFHIGDIEINTTI